MWTKQTWCKEMLRLMLIDSKMVEVGDCMEWQGGYVHGKPYVYEGTRRLMVRRLIAQASGKPVTDKKRVVPGCGNAQCVCNTHLKVVSIPESMAFAGRNVNVFARNRSIAVARRKNGKVSEALADQIRASNDNNIVEAAKHGIHHSYVSLIRCGKACRPETMRSNPFSQLLGMAA